MAGRLRQVLDLVAFWKRDMESYIKQGKFNDLIQSGSFKSRFVYRVKYYIAPPRGDLAAEALTFFQGVSDVVSGRYTTKQPISRSHVYRCAALQLLVEQKSRSDCPDPSAEIADKLRFFLPAKFCDQEARGEKTCSTLTTRCC